MSKAELIRSDAAADAVWVSPQHRLDGRYGLGIGGCGNTKERGCLPRIFAAMKHGGYGMAGINYSLGLANFCQAKTSECLPIERLGCGGVKAAKTAMSSLH
jgi:hypothetical protein